MGLIVDNCIASAFFSKHSDYLPARNWIYFGKGKLVFGGKLADELKRNKFIKEQLAFLWKNGAAFYYPRDKIEIEIKKLQDAKRHCSDDEHVLALAIVSKANILCSDDDDLRKDFKDTKIINNPRGYIYTAKGANKLLYRKANKCEVVPLIVEI